MDKLIKISLFLSSAIAGVFLISCQHTAPKENMENHQHTHAVSTYACPMHLDVTGKEGDKCSICGMDLVAADPKDSERYQVKLATVPEAITAGAPAKLIFGFKEKDQNVQLGISHEMKVHLMVISDDLTWFRHIHPEEQVDGTYSVTETFPHGGKYLLFTDFKPAGAAQVVNRQEIDVKGNPLPKNEEGSKKWISKTEGYTVKLENGHDFKTNQTQHLEISIEKGGKHFQKKDMQNYLGAVAHIVMIGKADKNYLHIHPVSDDRFPIYAETHIEKPGIYKMWIEFKIDGQVHTVDFVVDVTEGVNNGDSKEKHTHEH